jgi:hypothetical protein
MREEKGQEVHVETEICFVTHLMQILFTPDVEAEWQGGKGGSDFRSFDLKITVSS